MLERPPPMNEFMRHGMAVEEKVRGKFGDYQMPSGEEKRSSELANSVNQHRRAPQPVVTPAAAGSIAAKPSELPDGQLCVVCLDQKRTHIVIPCGHVIYCEKCVTVAKVCSICRGNIAGKYRVYFS